MWGRARAQVGRGVVRREGTDVALLAYGTATNDALKAADMLARSGVSATVVDMRCVGLRRTLRSLSLCAQHSREDLFIARSLLVEAVYAHVQRRQHGDVLQRVAKL